MGEANGSDARLVSIPPTTQGTYQSPDETTRRLSQGLQVARGERILRAGFDTSLVDAEIPMKEDELDSFIQTFAEGEVGDRVRQLIAAGTTCEEIVKGVRCEFPAVASVDFSGGTVDDSMFACRGHIRDVYRGVIGSVRAGEISSEVRINGKLISGFQPGLAGAV